MKNTRKMLMLFLAGTLFLLPSCDKDKEPEVIDVERITKWFTCLAPQLTAIGIQPIRYP